MTIYVFKKKWNEIFMQFWNKLRHFFRYENDIWFKIKTKYDDEKLICRAMWKCLKKFCFHFYDVRFVLKIDSKILIAQFNRSNTNFLKSLMTRWIAWIWLFDFEIQHVKNKKNSIVKKLTQKFLTKKNRSKIRCEKMNGSKIEISMNVFCFNERKKSRNRKFWKNKKIECFEWKLFWKIQNDCSIFMNFKKINWNDYFEFLKMKKKCFNFKMQNRQFFRQNIKNVFSLKIIDNQKKRNEIVKHMHDESEHQKWKKTFRQIVDRYYWKNMYEEIRTYVKICERCQFKNFRREKKILHFIWISYLWQKIIMNVVHMFKNHEKFFFVVTKNDLFEGIKIKIIFAADFDKMIKFLWKNVICRHKCFEKLIINEKSEDRNFVAKLCEKYDDKRVMISFYHSQINEMIEKKHKF